MLGGLIKAMSKGEDMADEARHFKRSITGDGQGSLLERLDIYIEQLKTVGHSHRVRLNLGRKDPAIAPLRRGILLLSRCAKDLGRIDALSSVEHQKLSRTLKIASHLLNTEGYEAVIALLDALRAYRIDENTLFQAFDRASREPKFVGIPFAPVHVDVPQNETIAVVIPKAAFDDIMTNLIRNAIQSSVQFGQLPKETSAGGPGPLSDDRSDSLTANSKSAASTLDPVIIGLAVSLQLDEITGIERVVIAVRDRAPRTVTAEMLRGRYIEQGLGLTADLVSRYDGTIDVIPGDGGWSKAVVVKIPRADLDQE
jgi:hypothetical protein